jgi:hypothetical protein
MSWSQLIAIREEQVTTVLAERDRPLSACPNDGEPLRAGPDGELFCPFDGWPNEGGC